MVYHHIMARHHLKRDDIDPTAVPSASGFAGAVTATDTDTQTTGLALDPNGGDVSITAPNVGPTSAIVTITPVITGLPSSTAEPSASATAAAAASHTSISMGTVIGACVGAAVGAIGLIGLAFMVYKRYSQSLKARARTRRVWPTTRNLDNDAARRRSHLEPWNKLEEGDDKWEGMYQTKEDNVAPMEKLTMFKKSPSVRTAWTHKSAEAEEPVEFDTNMFAQYHPQLAQELAGADKTIEKKPSIVNVRSVSGDSMNSASQALPTPPAVYSSGHRWESAEVLHFEPEPMSTTKPEAEEKILTEKNILERRRVSQHNPFFGASANRGNPSRSRSNSLSRSNSVAAATPSSSAAPSLPTVVTPATPKGKEREILPDDPFADATTPTLPDLKRPFAATHAPSDSTSSMESQERALRSLIAALDGADISEAEVQERLRVASMQPSIVSQTSAYSVDEELTKNFPLPPSVDGSHTTHPQ